MKLQSPRGTADLMPDEMARHRKVMDTARRLGGRFGFEEMATPIFEFTDVFARPLGEGSDVVTKETYSFTDRGGEGLTLRPEGTAGVVRALISAGLTQTLPQKFYYSGPMFRYERPQKGRMRQFHQIGVELLGPGQPLADAEVIHLGQMILEDLGVAGNCVLCVVFRPPVILVFIVKVPVFLFITILLLILILLPSLPYMESEALPTIVLSFQVDIFPIL